MLNIVYLNARSIVNKIDDLNILAHDNKPELILVTETWCNENIPDSLLNIPNYYIEPKLRCDRNDTVNGIGGGLLVFVRNGLTVLPIDDNSDFNQYCKFKVLDQKLDTNFYITLAYRSPNSTTENNDKLCDVINNLSDNDFELIIGDFNMPQVDWNNYSSTSRKYDRFVDVVINKGLSQLIDFPTHIRGNILDLALTNHPEKILNIESLGNLSSSDHSIISIDVLCNYKTDDCDLVLDWNKADKRGFSNHLSKANLCAKFKSLDVQDSYELLKKTIKEATEIFVPKKKRRQLNKPVWMNAAVIKLSRQKQRRYDIYMKNKTEENHNIYKKLEKKCKKAVRNAKRKFEKKLANNTNKKPFNAYLRTKTKTRTNVGPLVENNNIVTDSVEMAKILNNYFASVFTNDFSSVNVVTDSNSNNDIPELNQMFVTVNQTKEQISKLKNTNSCGPDGISTFVLKTFCDELAEPLAMIFNKSLKSSEVPTDWLFANVTPIHKKGSKGKAENYRPISLTCVPCKLLESMIKINIVNHIERNMLMKLSQHGFSKGRSCTTNLLEFLEDLVNYVENGKPVDVIYLDFAKAFDKVPIKKLLQKLKAMKIDGKILKWISNWLNSRKQRVVINGEESDWVDVLSGVPQGSVLGPLLFLIYINDIDDAAPFIKVMKKFADDTKLGHPVTSENDRKQLQEQLNSLCVWANKWGMEFNVSKCKVMHFGKNNPKFDYSMKNSILAKVDHEKDLGVQISSNLKPSQHCREIARKAKGILKQITKAFHFRDRFIFLNLYKRYVRVHLEYSSPSWCPWQTGDIEELEQVQKKAVGMISGLSGNTYEEKLRELKLPSLILRRMRADMIQTFKIIKGMDKVDKHHWFKAPQPGRRTTRNIPNIDGENSLQVLFHHTEIGKNFFSTRATKDWNNLPVNVKSTDKISVFKKLLDKYIETLI